MALHDLAAFNRAGLGSFRGAMDVQGHQKLVSLLSSTGILGTTCVYSVNTNLSPSSKFNNSSCTRAIDPCRVTVYYHSGTGGKPRFAHSRLHLSLNAPQLQNAVYISRHGHWLAERGSWSSHIAEGQDAAYHFPSAPIDVALRAYAGFLSDPRNY
ncbi:hypothetical protein CONLIGDRAFT_643385 [Coniochaeta ligniaria NRRL 30616]|uniref:Uncharacterized protein n=1 Tax=Coniochaeta ligniaria NRRL 30616 TaxID=1408157 RepID=A0A1J7JUK1_9PEZI|nr:hypothetical protein CONLIGDRAFT_643385 [Coniochaeta ligniaria NRRL 30616]